MLKDASCPFTTYFSKHRKCVKLLLNGCRVARDSCLCDLQIQHNKMAGDELTNVRRYTKISGSSSRMVHDRLKSENLQKDTHLFLITTQLKISLHGASESLSNTL